MKQMENTEYSTIIIKDDLTLKRDDSGLSLIWKDMILRGNFIDLIPRIKPGRIGSELIVRAAKIPNMDEHPTAIDATAGLGEDALLLAAAGFNVKLFEKDEIIFALLNDTMARTNNLPNTEEYSILKDAVSRMKIFNEDSINGMRKVPSPDIVFLDPMFPMRRKNSLVGKKLQVLQQLELPCNNEKELLDAAISLKPKRIIIKRPPKGPYLAGVKPTFSLSGKSIRIDCLSL